MLKLFLTSDHGKYWTYGFVLGTAAGMAITVISILLFLKLRS